MLRHGFENAAAWPDSSWECFLNPPAKHKIGPDERISSDGLSGSLHHKAFDLCSHDCFRAALSGSDQESDDGQFNTCAHRGEAAAVTQARKAPSVIAGTRLCGTDN